MIGRIPSIIGGSAEAGPAGSARPRGPCRVDTVREAQPAMSGLSDLIEFGLLVQIVAPTWQVLILVIRRGDREYRLSMVPATTVDTRNRVTSG